MTPAELVATLAARGLEVTVRDGDILVPDGLSKEEEACVRENPMAVLAAPALKALDDIVAQHEAESEEEMVKVVEAGRERHERERAQAWLDKLATLDEVQVRSLAARGVLNREEVEAWDIVRQALLRRQAMRVLGSTLAGMTSRNVTVRLVE